MDTAARVDAVLRRWGIVEQLERAVDLSDGTHAEINGDVASIAPGAGVGFVYAGVEGEQLAALAGQSEDMDDEERYTMGTVLIVGDHCRLQPSSEGLYFELLPPPKEDPWEPSEGGDGPFDSLFDQSRLPDGTAIPVVNIHIDNRHERHVAWEQCNGFWRGALVIDFGKDLPPFVDDLHELPARDFVDELSEAFRGPLIEIGEFY